MEAARVEVGPSQCIARYGDFGGKAEVALTIFSTLRLSLTIDSSQTCFAAVQSSSIMATRSAALYPGGRNYAMMATSAAPPSSWRDQAVGLKLLMGDWCDLLQADTN